MTRSTRFRAVSYDTPAHRLLVRVAAKYGLDVRDARYGAYPHEVKARREWIRLVQDSWGLTISETARMLGVDRCAVRGARNHGPT